MTIVDKTTGLKIIIDDDADSQILETTWAVVDCTDEHKTFRYVRGIAGPYSGKRLGRVVGGMSDDEPCHYINGNGLDNRRGNITTDRSKKRVK